MASTPQALLIRLVMVLLLVGGVLAAWQLRAPKAEAPATQADHAAVEASSTAAAAGAGAMPAGEIAAAEMPLRLSAANDAYSGPSELSPALPVARITDLPRHDDWSQTAIEALVGLAEAGNAQAAVMLLRRYQRCAAYENAWRRAASIQRELEQASDARKRESLSTQLLQQGERLEADAQCKVLPPWSRTTLFDLQWRAASLGDRQAILELAVNPALSSVPPIRHRDRYDRYQSQVLGLLQGLLQRGDLDAVRLLADVHADPTSFRWLGQLVERDEQIALLYAQLYLSAGGRRYRDRLSRQSAEWSAQMQPVDAATMQQRAQALADRYFGPAVARNEMGYGATTTAERSGWFEGRPMGD
jgi:hypothetical protein